MVDVSRSIAVKASIESVFNIISEFANYPDYFKEIEEANVIKSSKRNAQVAFRMNVYAPIDYSLTFKLERPNCITWELDGKNSVIRKNSGSWKLEVLEEGLTDLRFETDVELSAWIPKSIAKELLESNVPQMLERVKELSEGIIEKRL